jgi:hypothetical protein
LIKGSISPEEIGYPVLLQGDRLVTGRIDNVNQLYTFSCPSEGYRNDPHHRRSID